MEERSVQIFIPYERSFSLVFEKNSGLPLLAKTNAPCSAVSAIAELLVGTDMYFYVLELFIEINGGHF